MKDTIGLIIIWAYIILSLTAFVRLVILGESILGTTGIVALNLSAFVIFIWR